MENENNLYEQTESGEPKASKSRKYWYIIGAILLIVVVVLVVTKKMPENSPSNTGDQIVKERLVNLSGDERKLLESQLAGYTEQIKGLSGDSFVDQRDALSLKIAGVEYKLGKYQDAVDTLSKVSEAKQKEPRIWALYTNIYKDMGDKVKALDSAHRALEMDKENPSFWMAVLDLSTDIPNDEQKKNYENAINRTDNNVDIITSYAKFLEKIGDKPGAILMWQKAGQLDDKDKATYDAEVKRLQQ